MQAFSVVGCRRLRGLTFPSRPKFDRMPSWAKRKLEAAACTLHPIDLDGMNAKARLPFGVEPKHVLAAMQEYVDFLGFVNGQMATRDLPRLETMLMPANFSSMVGEFMSSTIPKHCTGIVKNRHHNGHPDLIPARHPSSVPSLTGRSAAGLFMRHARAFDVRQLGFALAAARRAASFCPSASSSRASTAENEGGPSWPGRKTTMADGKGALPLPSPNLRRRLTRRTSAARITYSCHQALSVRAGTRQTTVTPASAAWHAFCHPGPDAVLAPAVGRVAKGRARPLLGQAVVGDRVVAVALVVLVRGADVEVEAELGVEGVEDRLRRGPVVGLRGEAGAASGPKGRAGGRVGGGQGRGGRPALPPVAPARCRRRGHG